MNEVQSSSGIALGGCFPRAWPQPPQENHFAGSSDSCYSRWSHRPPLTQTGVCVSYCYFIILLSQQLFFRSKQRVLTIKVQFAPTLAEEKHEDSCGRKA